MNVRRTNKVYIKTARAKHGKNITSFLDAHTTYVDFIALGSIT